MIESFMKWVYLKNALEKKLNQSDNTSDDTSNDTSKENQLKNIEETKLLIEKGIICSNINFEYLLLVPDFQQVAKYTNKNYINDFYFSIPVKIYKLKHIGYWIQDKSSKVISKYINFQSKENYNREFKNFFNDSKIFDKNNSIKFVDHVKSLNYQIENYSNNLNDRKVYQKLQKDLSLLNYKSFPIEN
jgi:hypothetical protein